MREPDEVDSRSLFAVVWAEPENADNFPPFNIVQQVWDANSNATVDELVGPSDNQWVNQPADERADSLQISPAVCFVGEDIVVTWVGEALPIDESTVCAGGDRIFARRFKLRNNQIVNPDPQAGEGEPGMFIVDNDPNMIDRSQAHPTVALKQYPGSVDDMGAFIVAWNVFTTFDPHFEVRGAYFDRIGSPRGRELRLNVDDGADGIARLARSGVHTVAYGADGQVVLTWTQGSDPDPSQANVFVTILPDGFWRDGQSACGICVSNPECCQPCIKGDLTGDCLIDGDDIQPFIDLLYGGPEALCLPVQLRCAADINGDDVIDVDDVPPFVCLLLRLGPDCTGGGGPCPGYGGSAGDGESQSMQMAEGAGQNESSAAPLNPELAAAYELLREWRCEHPREAYPELTQHEYRMMELRYREQIGLDRPGLADAIEAYDAWRAANPRTAYPELTTHEYNDLCLQMMIELGVFLAAP